MATPRHLGGRLTAIITGHRMPERPKGPSNSVLMVSHNFQMPNHRQPRSALLSLSLRAMGLALFDLTYVLAILTELRRAQGKVAIRGVVGNPFSSAPGRQRERRGD